MAYSLTSANTLRELLAAIVVFAQAQGWTVEYNNASTSTGNGGQIALSSGECHIAIGERAFNANPVAVTGGSDAYFSMALANSINTGISQFWGHPGSNVTTNNDNDQVVVNDVVGPMTEVHFFGNSEYVWCVVRSAAARYTSFGFGLLDNLGMTGPRVAFALGGFHSWYDTTIPAGVGIQRRAVVVLGNGNHTYWPSMVKSAAGYLTTQSSAAIRIPNGFLNTGIGFPAGNVFMDSNLIQTMSWFNANQGVVTNNISMTGFLMDFAIGNIIKNQPVTGGIPLFEIPIMIWKDSNLDALCLVGAVPGVRLANIRDIEPSEEQMYGTEVWKFFPWKQKGLTSDVNQCNTYTNGFGFLKAS